MLDGAGHVLTPGLLDIHNHGGAGASYGERRRRQSVRLGNSTATRHYSSAALAGRGVPDVLILGDSGRGSRNPARPTIMGSTSRSVLAREYCGAHDPTLLRDPDPALVERLLAAADGTLRQVTMARAGSFRRVGADPARRGRVVVAVGHTAATFEQARAAIEAGASLLTHTFNGMPGVHHRAPGPVLAFVENPDGWLEVVNDGIHVRSEVIPDGSVS